MNDLDTDEAQLLDRARRGLGPTASDRERVTQALQSQLAVAGVQAAATSRLDPKTLHVAPWIRIVAGIALGGALGYFQGYRAGVRHRERVTVVRSVPAVLPLAPPSSVPSERLSLPTPTQTRALPVLPNAARPSRTGSSVRASSELPRPSDSPGLDEEVRQLRRVEKAIRGDNPRLALALLSELDATIPAGQLSEERSAASLMANCQLDAASAQETARAFTRQHPQSAYAARILEMCQPRDGDTGERISPASGTSVPR